MRYINRLFTYLLTYLLQATSPFADALIFINKCIGDDTKAAA